MGTMNDNNKPNEIVGMDLIGLLNGRYILATVDYLS